MRKPTLMIAVGFPGGPHGQQDEDSLQREQDGNGGDDIAVEAISQIVRHLHDAGPSAVRDLRAHAHALLELCDAFMSRNQSDFEDAASNAVDTLHELISDQ